MPTYNKFSEKWLENSKEKCYNMYIKLGYSKEEASELSDVRYEINKSLRDDNLEKKNKGKLKGSE